MFCFFSGAHAVDREYRVMTALHNYSKVAENGGVAAFPVPQPLLFCSEVPVIGTPFFCYGFVKGRFFKAPQMKSVM